MMHRGILTMTTALVATGITWQAQAQDDGFTLDPILLNSAFRDERALLDTPVSVSVVEGETLDNRQAGDFQELIGDVPGLSIDGGPRGISQEPNIRGFRDEQIVLRFDGGRFNFGQAHRGRFFIDPDLVQRVEVIRGGGSTLFGSGALGGVISVETRDVSDLLAPGQTMGGRLSLGYSSNGDAVNASSTVFADWGAWDAMLFLGARQLGENMESGGGVEIPFSEIDLVNGLIKVGFEPSADSRIELSFSAFEDEGLTPANSSGNPGLGNPTVEREASVRSFRLSWDYAPSGSDAVDLSVLLYGEQLDITENRVDVSRLDETRYDTIGLEVTNRSRLDFGVPVDLVYGFEVFRDTQEGLRDGAPRGSFPNAEATTIGIFTEATMELSPQFDLIAGLRFDQYERDPDDPALAEVSETFFSPRIGFSYRPVENWQVYGNLARAFRAPSLSELYNSGLHFPGRPNNFFVPNPDLKPEESTQVELGARFERGGVWQSNDRLSFAANVYFADVENYIEQIVDVPGGTTSSSNVDAQLWGFEAEAEYDAETWFLGAGIGIARGEGDDGDWLGSIPQDRLTLHGGYRPNDAWELGARATFAAEQDRVPAGGSVGPSYEVLDLYATFSPDRGPLANGTFRIGVDNLFDETYQIYPNGLSQPGRTLEISATFTF
jgi:hemoglobin/transferrin/lactoferrin receptor protein